MTPDRQRQPIEPDDEVAEFDPSLYRGALYDRPLYGEPGYVEPEPSDPDITDDVESTPADRESAEIETERPTVIPTPLADHRIRPIDHALAADIAGRAGELLLELRESAAERGLSDAALRDEGDRRSHELIMEVLEELVPDDAVLSEEGRGGADRLTAERVWIVDPLDGTREFGDAGRIDWAVHVALVVDGNPVAGAVALPAVGQTLATRPSPPVPPPSELGLRIVVSRTRPPAFTEALANALSAEVTEMGSAGAKAMAVVLGDADIYVHSGGQYEWDSAAPVAVARAAGLHCSRLDGSPLVYNNPDPYLPDLLVCRSELAELILASLQTIT